MVVTLVVLRRFHGIATRIRLFNQVHQGILLRVSFLERGLLLLRTSAFSPISDAQVEIDGSITATADVWQRGRLLLLLRTACSLLSGLRFDVSSFEIVNSSNRLRVAVAEVALGSAIVQSSSLRLDVDVGLQRGVLQ